jgi:Flp pilus assembly protein TadD
MSATAILGVAGRARGNIGALAIVALALPLGACAQMGSMQAQLAAGPATSPAGATAAAPDNRSELLKATEYWGKAAGENPRDPQASLNYAKNLKALGEKRHALAVLQQAYTIHSNHRGIAAEYGRLALQFDQVSMAEKLLAQADDPTNPDWTLISARGTVLAKQGRYRDAIPFYERALALAPDKPSTLSNLALAHAMEGHPDKAEPLLKQAAALGGHDAQVSQNLALVLGLQGKYDEAKLAAAKDLPADKAAANVDYVRAIVRADPKPLATAAIADARPAGAGTEAASAWATRVARAGK